MAPARPDRSHDFFAIAAPGLEQAVAREVAALPGVGAVTPTAGGVGFSGPAVVGMDANLRLRVATRVVLRLGAVEARDFSTLRDKLARLPWQGFVPPHATVRVAVSVRKCRLLHSGAIAERTAQAIGARLGAPVDLMQTRVKGSVVDDESTHPASLVLLRGERDRFVVSIDTSGALLHRRGYRPEAGPAPLRETLAAGLLDLAGWAEKQPLVDPMCGAGTLAIEAGLRAMRCAPGLQRRFAFESWPSFDRRVFEGAVSAARAEQRDRPPAAIFARDASPVMVELARQNAERAAILPHIDFAVARFAAAPPPCERGLLIVNPPYGRRLGSTRAAHALLRDIGTALKGSWRGLRAAILVADPPAERAIGLPPGRVFAVANGGLRVRLLVFEPR